MTTQELWIALLSLVGGGFGITFLNKVAASKDKSLDHASQFTTSMLGEMVALRERCDLLGKKIDETATKYNDLLKEHVDMKADYEIQSAEFKRLKEQHHRAEEQCKRLELQMSVWTTYMKTLPLEKQAELMRKLAQAETEQLIMPEYHNGGNGGTQPAPTPMKPAKPDPAG